jgi:hypothetical protein
VNIRSSLTAVQFRWRQVFVTLAVLVFLSFMAGGAADQGHWLCWCASAVFLLKLQAARMRAWPVKKLADVP